MEGQSLKNEDSVRAAVSCFNRNILVIGSHEGMDINEHYFVTKKPYRFIEKTIILYLCGGYYSPVVFGGEPFVEAAIKTLGNGSEKILTNFQNSLKSLQLLPSHISEHFENFKKGNVSTRKFH